TQDDQEGGEANRTLVEGPNQEQYDNRAFPQTYIAAQQQLAAYLAFQSIGKLPGGTKTNWQELGPVNPLVVGPWTYTGRTTTDAGASWTLVPGSLAVAIDRSLSAIAVDPSNPNHLYVGTAVARHGSSSVNGGRFTPPGAPLIGVYESTDGGATFALVFSKPADVVDPTSPTGNDFFRGGISKISYAPDGRLYVSVFDYGLYRSVGSAGFEQVFASAGGGLVANSLSARTEFSLAPLANGNLRIYVGDTGSGLADFYSVDNANVPTSALTNGVINLRWTTLSNSTEVMLGFASYADCGWPLSLCLPL